MTRPDIEAAIARAEVVKNYDPPQGTTIEERLSFATFIAAARTDVPELARYALAQEARVKELEAVLGDICHPEESEAWQQAMLDNRYVGRGNDECWDEVGALRQLARAALKETKP